MAEEADDNDTEKLQKLKIKAGKYLMEDVTHAEAKVLADFLQKRETRIARPEKKSVSHPVWSYQTQAKTEEFSDLFTTLRELLTDTGVLTEDMDGKLTPSSIKYKEEKQKQKAAAIAGLKRPTSSPPSPTDACVECGEKSTCTCEQCSLVRLCSEFGCRAMHTRRVECRANIPKKSSKKKQKSSEADSTATTP